MDPSPLLIDLYELTMAACYYEHNMFHPATFSLFVRDYPAHRNYFVSAGLEEVVAFLESFSFRSKDVDYLGSTGLFSPEFLEYLSSLRFTGDVFAIPEGRLFFKNEPVIEITAPIIEAQLVETFLINAINFQMIIATKAARCVSAAGGRNLIDFSLRRTQGTDAGIKAARASYIGGFDGTSNVLAGKQYGIPTRGTMAHSFITSFTEEIDAFYAFAESFPDQTVLLIDTYDTLEGAKKAVKVSRDMRKRGKVLKGVRLDSGDMSVLSKEVRNLLDRAGENEVQIFASGGMDEYKIEGFSKNSAPIDAYGIGTKMGVSADAPYTDSAYKLVEYQGRPVLKLSTGKKTLVGRKQVFRRQVDGKMAKDIIALRQEQVEGEPLLMQVMQKGARQSSPEPLSVIRDRFLNEFSTLEDRYKKLNQPESYPVELGLELQQLQQQVVHDVRERELGES